MTQLTRDFPVDRIREKLAEYVEALSEALGRVARRIDQERPRPPRPPMRQDRPARPAPRVVPSHEATPLGLALDPYATIQLSEEQTEIALAIERDAASADREAAHTG